MDIKEILAIVGISAFGGVIRAIVTRQSIISFSVFMGEALVGGFVGIVTGIALSNYTNLNSEVIWGTCAIAGFLARDILPKVIEIASRKLDKIEKISK